MRKLPFSIHDSERDILVRRSCTEVEQDCVLIARLFYNFIRRRLRFVDQIRIENVELIALYNFGRGVIHTTTNNSVYDRNVIGKGKRTRSEFDYICSTRSQYAHD